MSTIRIVYSAEPKFPASDQHPNAVRYVFGSLWVDAIDGVPTQQEVDAVLSPPDSTRVSALKGDLSLQDLISRLQSATPIQIDSWLSANVTSLAQARTVLGAVVKVLALFLRTG